MISQDSQILRNSARIWPQVWLVRHPLGLVRHPPGSSRDPLEARYLFGFGLLAGFVKQEDPGGVSYEPQGVSHKPHLGPDSSCVSENLAVLADHIAVLLRATCKV